MNYRLTLSLFVACITVAGSLSIARADEEAKVTYDEHVRPILARTLFHLPQSERAGVGWFWIATPN